MQRFALGDLFGNYVICINIRMYISHNEVLIMTTTMNNFIHFCIYTPTFEYNYKIKYCIEILMYYTPEQIHHPNNLEVMPLVVGGGAFFWFRLFVLIKRKISDESNLTSIGLLSRVGWLTRGFRTKLDCRAGTEGNLCDFTESSSSVYCRRFRCVIDL